MGVGLRGVAAGRGRLPRSERQQELDQRAVERLTSLLAEEGLQ